MPGYKQLLVLVDLSQDSEQVAIAGRDLAAHSNAAMNFTEDTVLHAAHCDVLAVRLK